MPEPAARACQQSTRACQMLEPARACQSLPEPARACQSPPEARQSPPQPARARHSLPEPARAARASLPEPARASLPEPARARQSLPGACQSLTWEAFPKASQQRLSLPWPARACRAWACQILPEPAPGPAAASLERTNHLPQTLPQIFSGALRPSSQYLNLRPPSKASPGFQEPPGLLRAFWVQGVFLPEVLFRPLARSTRQFFPQLCLFLKHFVLPVRMLLGQIPRRFPHLTGRFQLYSKITTIRVLRTLQRFRRRTSPMAAKS